MTAGSSQLRGACPHSGRVSIWGAPDPPHEGQAATKEMVAMPDHMGVSTRETPVDGLSLIGAGRGEIEVVYRRSYPVFLRVAAGIIGDEFEAADAVRMRLPARFDHAAGFDVPGRLRHGFGEWW
jgi:hypothetical protein